MRGTSISASERLELVEAGTQSAEDFDRTVRDLVNFLAYMGEPVKLERQSLGIKVTAVPVAVLYCRLPAQERVLEGRPLILHATGVTAWTRDGIHKLRCLETMHRP